MSDNVIIALVSFAGTVIGSLLGIMAANKLVVYRIEQLEKKVEKHNHLTERTLILEKDMQNVQVALTEIKKGQNDENTLPKQFNYGDPGI